MDQQMFQQILQRYFKGEATDEERRIVDEWYEAMGKGDQSLLDASQEAALQQRYWSVISGHIRKSRSSDEFNTTSARTRTKPLVWYSMGIAASLIIVMVSYYFLRSASQPVRKEVTSDQQYASVVWTELENNESVARKFDLPDGSRISLEPNSHLKYGQTFNKEKREVFLEGEAHFDVAHDTQRPFLVHAREVTTTVLGTSFRVKAFDADKDIMVAVQSGRVAVQAERANKKDPTKSEIILTPNQQIVYNRNEGTMLRGIVKEPQPIPAEEKIRRMRFEEAPVAEIFSALERVYGVDIVFDKNQLSSCVLTTSISDGGIYNRLDIICEAIGAEYTVNEGEIVITGSGCD